MGPTPEAEIIAFAAALFGETLHIQETLQRLLEQDVRVKLEQDNETVIKNDSEPLLSKTASLQSCTSC